MDADPPVVGEDDAGVSDGPPVEPPPMNALSYARDILPIMQAHCTECHHEGRAPDFTVLPRDTALRAMLADRIIARATTTMPPPPRDHLEPGDVMKIEQWKDDGVWP